MQVERCGSQSVTHLDVLALPLPVDKKQSRLGGPHSVFGGWGGKEEERRIIKPGAKISLISSSADGVAIWQRIILQLLPVGNREKTTFVLFC